MIEKSELLIWMDASIRWSNDTQALHELLRRATHRGLQTGINPLGAISLRTAASTFRFYGDQPCQYDAHGEVTGGFGVFRNEEFVREAILAPWLSCAFHRTCMCVADFGKLLYSCRTGPPRVHAACHRFDQSSLGMIVSKLYGGRTSLLQLPHRVVGVDRSVVFRWLGT